jgi:sigma-E factor negative regulatory protein RseB
MHSRVAALARVTALFSAVFAGPLFAAEALDLLERMSESMRSSNYKGTFVYRHKDKVETLKIIHRYGEEGVSERLITLTGKPREIIRDGETVTCILPDRRLVLIDDSRRKSRFPGVVPDDLSRLSEYYTLRVLDEPERIAGLLSRVVEVMPGDSYRYGYRLWIADGSNLLVRSDLLNNDNKTVEQVIFTELERHERLSDDLFKPQYLKEGYSWREMGKADASGGKRRARWATEAVPPGFLLTTHKRRLKPHNDRPVEHMVFSDGMASVSVFVESGERDNMVRGSVRRGALSIYGKEIGDHHITVMGEVPGSTVESIAESITLDP